MNEEVNLKTLKKKVILLFIGVFVILGSLFFLPAWTLKYWEGWVYIFIIAIPMSIFGLYLLKHDPKLLERRVRMKEKQKDQKLIVKLSLLLYLPTFMLPGFDKRFGWSDVPLVLTIISFVIVFLGYMMTIYVFKTNSYASRIIEVEQGQKVIDTGPYAFVRHPMYLSLIIFYSFTPLALGSYWAMIPACMFVLVFIPRIIGEERELLKNLTGYQEYTQKVKYRLFPGVW
ncbi:MAG: isoprenylcysteine carboxylmethyltransferase family protein [Elusimicrobiota bacterium]